MNPSDPVRVGVNGALGRMGRAVTSAVEQQEGFELAFAADRGDDLGGLIRREKAQVVVDFTEPAAAFENARCIFQAGACPVIGTTGLGPRELETLHQELSFRGLGGLYAPNFSLGALVMIRLAEEAARFFSRCEIIELHHDRKLDSPSGTALLTAERLAARIPEERSGKKDESSAGRGLESGPVRIHSVRLPGLLAHQEVLFGGPGETLTIRHDVHSRDCFIPGVLLAIRQVLSISGLQVGLDLE